MAGVNKVIGKNGEVIIDISEDTVTAALLAEGATAHAANGDVITGIGQDVSFIDDTAGTGDVGYVWSADKSYKEITDLKNSLEITSGMELITNWVPNKYFKLSIDPVDINSPFTSSTGLHYVLLQCEFGEKFYVSGVSTATSRTWAFIDSSGNILSRATKTFSESYHEIFVSAPKNAAYLIINSKTDDPCYKVIPSMQLNSISLDTTKIGAIPVNSDLNDYVIPGNYRIDSSENAATIANIPLQSPGKLIVMNIDTSASVYQIFMALDSNIYYRYGNSNEWNDWEQITKIENINININKRMSLYNSESNALTAGADLNEYITPGQWRIPTQAIAVQLINKPVDYGTTGALIVMNTHNNNHIYQVLLPNNVTDVTIWVRYINLNGPTYSDWVNLAQSNQGDMKTISWMDRGKFVIHNPTEELETLTQVTTEILGNGFSNFEDYSSNISSTAVYQLWDWLQQQHPDYIDEGEIIGYSLDTEGNNYLPLKAYYIHPRMEFYMYGQTKHTIPFSNTPSEFMYMYDPNTPTIFILAGTHGGERMTPWVLFEIFRRAFERGSIYAKLLRGTCYRVIPCNSRWSFDNGKRYLAAAYDSEGNEKPGIDLTLYDANRMLICSDDSNPSYSTLRIPAYGTEARAITDYIESHGIGTNPKNCFIDLHHPSYSCGYLTTYKTNIAQMYNSMIDELAKDWLQLSTYKNGRAVDYYETTFTSQGGKILARNSTAHSYSWFYDLAYNVYSANTIEFQHNDNGGTMHHNAAARGMDQVYRWISLLHENVKGL